MEGKRDGGGGVGVGGGAGSGDEKKKHTFKGAAKAVSLASKLSPKSQRKKASMAANTSQLKVNDNPA